MSMAFLCLGLGAVHPATAQPDPRSAPSPVAPGDLSRPVFDTTTRVYDSAASLDKAANTVVAEVEGRPITLGDVSDAIRALPPNLAGLPFDTLYPGVLLQLIKQEALVVRAQQQGVDEDPIVRRKVKGAADRQLAEEYMQREISKGITEAMLLDRYDRDVAGRPGEEEVRARVMLTDSQKEASDLIAELRGGADFATVARRASKDATASAGGDLGFRVYGGLIPEIAAGVAGLPTGQVTPYPVRGTTGWFVVKVEERRRQPAPGFSSVREQLRQTLLRERVASATATALTGLKVRQYSFTGQEVNVDQATPDSAPLDKPR
jgi:peptidyl-prolyl cis-trans isomerase C